MTLPANATPLYDRAVGGGQLVDVSAASISYASVWCKGVIAAAYASISAAITSADCVVTVKVIKSGVTSTVGTITIANSGSAAGTVTAMVITGTEAVRSVEPGDTVVFDSDGASSTTAIANFVAVVRGT